MRAPILLLLSLLWTPAAFAVEVPAASAVEVKVGAYDFPPYVTDQGGVTGELVALLNSSQTAFVFTLVATTSRDRYGDLQSGKYDIILFEDSAWGWANTPAIATTPFHADAAVYVALRRENRGQEFFADLSSRTLLIRRGYHYSFAGFNADEAFLARNFRVQIYDTPQQIVDGLLAEQGDIAVITQSFLAGFLAAHPEQQPKLLIADKVDQAYHLGALLRPDGPLSRSKLEELITALQRSGTFAALLKPRLGRIVRPVQ